MAESQKSRKKARSIHSLPEDIEIDILARLPVKSLMRFRLVCKAWCNLLLDQDFIDRHHKVQIANSNETIVVTHGDTGAECFSILSTSRVRDGGAGAGDDHEILSSIVERISVSSVNGSQKPLEILGPVKGLLCICGDGGDMIALWNPATREFKTLPFSPIKRLSDGKVSFYNVGFGFDAKNNDYKILRFVTDCMFVSGSEARGQVELYSLETDSWRELELPYPEVHWATSCHEPYNNAVYYWSNVDEDSVFAPFLLCFDFGNEVFRKLQLPSPERLIDLYSWPDDGQEYIFDPMIFNGRLSGIVCEHDRENKTTSIDIWFMTEDGGEGRGDAWNLHETLDTLEGLLEPLQFWKNKLFMRKEIGDSKGELVLYDLGTKQLKSLQLGGNIHKFYFKVSWYVESLVRLNNRGRVEHEPFVRRTIQN